MTAYAMEHGINYFDTAWCYHDGASERVMGRVLSDYLKERFCLADKFPGYDLANVTKVKALRPDETIPAWAFRFLQTLPEVTMTLSGMSDLPQMIANIETFASEKPLNDAELSALPTVADSN